MSKFIKLIFIFFSFSFFVQAEEASIKKIPVMVVPGNKFPKDFEEFKALNGCKIPEAPILYKNAAKDWPAIKKWNLDYFYEKYGDEFISVLDIDNVDLQEEISIRSHIFGIKSKPKYSYYSRDLPLYINSDNQTISTNEIFRKFLKRYREQLPFVNSSISYLSDNKEYISEIMNIDFPYNFVNSGVVLLLGSNHTVTPFHNHDSVFLAQIFGKKRVYLVSNEQVDFMYCDKIESPDKESCMSNIDPENIDIDKYPEFLKVKLYHADLGEGDILYIPNKWPHYVKALPYKDGSISVVHGHNLDFKVHSNEIDLEGYQENISFDDM